MRKPSVLLLSIFSLFLLILASGDVTAFQNHQATLSLSKNRIFEACKPGGRSQRGYDNGDKEPINVRIKGDITTAQNAVFEYVTTGGQIIGAGTNVKWDISKEKPGTYQIIALIKRSDGTISGRTAEKLATVENDCIQDCSCPENTSISRPLEPVHPGETIEFTANVVGGNQDELAYYWNVSAGKIVDGQGTPTISVSTSRKMASTELKTTVKFGKDGFCDGKCLNGEASTTLQIEKRTSYTRSKLLRLWELKLSSTQAPLWCPISESDLQACSKKDEKLKIEAVAAKDHKKTRRFNYKVSGGRIIGEGRKVIWDLSQTGPGIYTISGWIVRNGKRGNLISKTVTRGICPVCDPGCECPTVEIESSQDLVKSGETIKLVAIVKGGDQTTTSVKWKVKNGRIVGKRKRSVIVDVDSSATGKNLEIVLIVDGLCTACVKVFTKTISITD